MIYATFSEFSARYAAKVTEAEVNSHLLPFASARVEAALGPYFPVPFQGDNLTAKDLTLDLAYLIVLQRAKDPADAAALSKNLDGRLAALAAGRAAMISASGDLLFAQPQPGGVWSSHGRVESPVFDTGPSGPADPDWD